MYITKKSRKNKQTVIKKYQLSNTEPEQPSAELKRSSAQKHTDTQRFS